MSHGPTARRQTTERDSRREGLRTALVIGLAVVGLLLGSVSAVAAPRPRTHILPSLPPGKHPTVLPHRRGELGRVCNPGYCPTPPLLFHAAGRGVQHTPTLYLIFWGSNWNGTGATLRQQLINMYDGLAGSAYQGILTQYYDAHGFISSSVDVAAAYTDTGVSAPSSVSDSSITSEVASMISARGWTRSFDAQFVVLTAPGSTYASGFGSKFCAYHGIDSGGSSYTFVPYVGDQPFDNGCSGYDPNFNVNHVTSMLAAHEYSESATDPQLDTWYTSDTTGYEIADICASGDDVLSNGSYVQGLWDDAQNQCSLSDVTHAPAADSSSRPAARDVPSGSQWVYYVTSGQIGSWSWNGSSWSNSQLAGGQAASSLIGPSVIRDVPTSDQWLYYDGTDGNVWYWAWDGSSWTNGKLTGGQTAANASPSVVRDQTTGYQWVYYIGADGNLWYWSWNATSWTNGKLTGGQAAANASPTVLRDVGSGDQWVYYVGADGSLWYWSWNGSSWTNGKLAGENVASSASPSAVRDVATGSQWVYYIGADGNVWSWSWNGSSWTNNKLAGGQAASSASPTVVRDVGTGDQWVYYVGADGNMWYWSWNGSSWTNGKLTGELAASGASPTVLRDVSSGSQWVYYVGADGRMWLWSWNGSNWSNSAL